MTNNSSVARAIPLRLAVCTIFVALGLLLLIGQFFGRSMIVFLVGAHMLHDAGGLLPIALSIVPVVWAIRTNWRWMAAALVPAISVVVIVLGYAVPASVTLPAYAYANLGPPIIAGQWVSATLIYVGLFGTFVPSHHASTRSPRVGAVFPRE